MDEHRDLPFYNGQPVEIGAGGWAIVLGAVVVAFGLLILLPFGTAPLSFIPAILFTGVPLAALALVAGRHWRALFGPFGIKQFGQAVGFGLLTTICSWGAGLILLLTSAPLAPNPVVGELVAAAPVDLAVMLLRAAIQLVGEEVATILPLLAVLWLCVSRFGLSRRAGLIIAVIASTLWFAALHLPTYNWNFLQCIAAIGVARLVLTASYLVTRNLWVSALAHIINDFTLFGIGILGLRLLAAGQGA